MFPSCPAGGSIDSDCAFEPDYAVPPLSMTEGMQHIRIMEGVTRSLPSSPLLSHQAIGVRLQPVKKLTGRGRCDDTCFLGSARGFADSVGKESTARRRFGLNLVRRCRIGTSLCSQPCSRGSGTTLQCGSGAAPARSVADRHNQATHPARHTVTAASARQRPAPTWTPPAPQ